MMRIKEAIQRRRLIQQLNDEYAAIEDDSNLNAKNSASTLMGLGGGSSLPGAHSTLAYILRKKNCLERDLTDDDGGSIYGPGGEPGYLSDHHRAYLRLHEFVTELNQHLSDAQRRALRVTWKRLSEPPKTSGRGTLQIMEKIFDHVLSSNPDTLSIFYRSAFIKCIEERRTGCPSGTIATIRDHAHLLIDLIDGIMCVMFDTPFNKPVWDPATIGRAHAKYIPMGFEPNVWQKLGEHFAEIMFSQECVRAYPHAASAWSTLSVVITDKMYSQTRRAKNADFILSRSVCSTTSFTNAKQQKLMRKASLTSLALLPSGSSGIPGVGNVGTPVLLAKGATPNRLPIPESAISPAKKPHFLPHQKSVAATMHGGGGGKKITTRKKLPLLREHERAYSSSMDLLPGQRSPALALRRSTAHRKIGIFYEGANSISLSDEETSKPRRTMPHRQTTPSSEESCHEPTKAKSVKGPVPPFSPECTFKTNPLRRSTKICRTESARLSAPRALRGETTPTRANKIGATSYTDEIRSPRRERGKSQLLSRQKSSPTRHLPLSPARAGGEKRRADGVLRRGRVGAVMRQAHFSSSGESTDV